MGYEIVFWYCKKKEDGKGYESEHTESFSQKLGSAIDDVSLDDLAACVLKQMARRDKLIVDVEIFEYTKRKISFKETSGGILLKNKKFVLDGSGVQSTGVPDTFEGAPRSEFTEALPAEFANAAMLPANPPPPRTGLAQVMGAMRYEVFDPDEGYLQTILQKGYKMTPNKLYAILEEKSALTQVNNNGQIQQMPTIEYTVVDDNGAKLKALSAFFKPKQAPLVGQRLLDAAMADRNSGPKLLYQGKQGNDMPMLRSNY